MKTFEDSKNVCEKHEWKQNKSKIADAAEKLGSPESETRVLNRRGSAVNRALDGSTYPS